MDRQQVEAPAAAVMEAAARRRHFRALAAAAETANNVCACMRVCMCFLPFSVCCRMLPLNKASFVVVCLCVVHVVYLSLFFFCHGCRCDAAHRTPRETREYTHTHTHIYVLICIHLSIVTEQHKRTRPHALLRRLGRGKENPSFLLSSSFSLIE